jgi:probable HAF family extracellular repeat protein
MPTRWVRATLAGILSTGALVASGWFAGPAVASLDRTPIDLGTLGGTSSGANAVNNAGTVVGFAQNGANDNRAFRWTPTGGMVDLGTLGGPVSAAGDINEADQVVGTATTGTGASHAFIWDLVDGMTDLGTLGGTTSSAVAVNASGQVAGTSTLPSGATHAFRWDSVNGMVDIPGLGGTSAVTVGINDAGQVGGNAKITGDAAFHAFVWDTTNGTTDLGTLGGTGSWANAINAGGAVVGYSPTGPGGADERAFRWTSTDGMTNLGTLSGASRAAAINASGTVTGYTVVDGLPIPFRWTPTEPMTLLPYDDGFGVGGGEPARINASGQITGNIANGQRGFVTDRQGGSARLEGLLPDLTQVGDINDAGQVAGSWLVFYFGEQHAMLWSTGSARSISIAGASATEGDSGAHSIDFAVSLSAPSPTKVTVKYSVVPIPPGYATQSSPPEIPGYASRPADFTEKFFKTLTFGVPPGGVSTTTRYVHIDLPPDTTAEGDERFKVLLSNPTGGVTLGTSAVAARIIDNDPAAIGSRVSVGDAGIWEGDSGLGNAGRIRLALDSPALVPLTVKVTVAGGTATAGTDYRGFTRTIKFAAGSTSKILDVRALPDGLVENDETATITLSAPSIGLSIGRGTGTLTIQDDDR